MKVVLLQPPVRDFYDTEVRLQPLGLCALKAAVKAHLPGVEVRVQDYRQGWGRRTVKLPAELADLRAYYAVPDRSPFSTFYGYYHFGAAFEVLAEDVARDRPGLVGISSLFSAYHREVLQCAEEIKARCDVPVVVGGAHASAAPETLLAHPAVDFVIRGEGERPLVELLRALESGRFEAVPNLAYRRGSRLVLNPLAENYPLAEIPPPDFSDLPVARYRLGRRPLAALTASRGCPHRCRFCSMQGAFGNGYRRRPVGSLLAEIRLRHAQGYRALDFEDDNLTLARSEMETLCRGIIREYPEGELVLQAMNGVSYLSLDPELLGLMRRAGFTHMNLSLVSLDEATCRAMGRPHSVEAYLRVIHEAFRLGFGLVTYQILGLPGETVASMIATLVFSARLPVLLGASPFYLPPGAPLAEGTGEMDRERLVRCRLTALGLESRDEIYTLFVATRILNFLKGLPLEAGAEASLGEALAAARLLGERAAKGVELLERVFREGVLYAATPRGLEPLPRFRAGLFRSLWERLDCVATQTGATIRVGTAEGSSSASAGRRGSLAP
jgi:radical SAM superfamily enzyme YgiQ (UPF0313 family)